VKTDQDRLASMRELLARKNEFIGGTLVETDMGVTASTKIVNISLRQEKEWGGWVFRIRGRTFTCAYSISNAYWYGAETVTVGGYSQSCHMIPRTA